MLSQKQSNFMIIGVMSGTSLDGLDLVAIRFEKHSARWSYAVKLAETVNYPSKIYNHFKMAVGYSKKEIESLDHLLGEFIGDAILKFCGFLNEPVDFVASHGHTIFHEPDNGYTLQIGSGKVISETCGLPVINNFRAKDVSLGGQGAPLVPIGDRDLFAEYPFCLNLGGIANMTLVPEGADVIAYDICPFNMALNHLAGKLGLDFDDGGNLARQGKVDNGLLLALNDISYLDKAAPKSLGLEDYIALWLPLLEDSNISTQDCMCTFVEHAAIQIAHALEGARENEKVLVTGGGAFHNYFITRLRHLSKATVCIPDDELINFKDALVFAYLGLLRFLEEPNCLASVTGASQDNIGGDLHSF